MVGRTGPLSAAIRAWPGRLLAEPDGDHPWPATLPAGRFGQYSTERIVYTQVEPVRFLRIRHDLSASDLVADG
jgi:hypothetical protein